MWGDESEAVAPIIWLYPTVDAWKEEVLISNLLITLRRYDIIDDVRAKHCWRTIHEQVFDQN